VWKNHLNVFVEQCRRQLTTLFRVASVVSLIQQHCLLPHLYADDTQIYGACGTSDVGALLQKVTGCLTAVADWMSANRLQLNSDKTESSCGLPLLGVSTDYLPPVL